MDDETKKAEEQEVEDTDADTKDLTQEEDDGFKELSRRMSQIEETQTRIMGALEAIKSAQSVMVDMGAVIRDDNPADNSTDVDMFVPLEDMDFSL